MKHKKALRDLTELKIAKNLLLFDEHLHFENLKNGGILWLLCDKMYHWQTFGGRSLAMIQGESWVLCMGGSFPLPLPLDRTLISHALIQKHIPLGGGGGCVGSHLYVTMSNCVCGGGGWVEGWQATI